MAVKEPKIEYTHGDIISAIRRDIETQGYKATSVEIKLHLLKRGFKVHAVIHVKPPPPSRQN